MSVAKAGVVASLPSRCSVIAAANPKKGRYARNMSVAENVHMPAPLLSRFDLVFILRDEADFDQDRMISDSIMGQLHGRRHNRGGGASLSDSCRGRRVETSMDQFGTNELIPLKKRLPWVTGFQKQPLPLQQLKDYIAYAREYCRPTMSPEAAKVLHDYFMKLR